MTGKQDDKQKMQDVDVVLLKKSMPPGSNIMIVFGEKGRLQSIDTVVERIEHGHIWVDAKKTKKLEADEAVKVVFSTNEARYAFSTRIAGLSIPGLCGLKFPENWLRIQRRTNFRAPCQLKVAIDFVDSRKQSIIGRSINLSASGILLNVKGNLTLNDEIVMSFRLPVKKDREVDMRLKGRVARIQQGESEAIGIKFHDISSRDEDRLAQFLWRQTKEQALK